MVTKKEVDGLKEVIKSLRKQLRDCMKLNDSFEKQIKTGDSDVDMYKMQMKEIKAIAEKQGGELAIVKTENAKLREQIERLEKRVKK